MRRLDTQRRTISEIEKTRYLNGIRASIEDHLDEKHTINGLAAIVDVSSSWLQRAFKKTYGYSVFTFIRYSRLLRAQKQLEVTSMAIKTISTEAGYKSLPAFTAAFKAALGVSPGRYRKGIKTIVHE